MSDGALLLLVSLLRIINAQSLFFPVELIAGRGGRVGLVGVRGDDHSCVVMLHE